MMYHSEQICLPLNSLSYFLLTAYSKISLLNFLCFVWHGFWHSLNKHLIRSKDFKPELFVCLFVCWNLLWLKSCHYLHQCSRWLLPVLLNGEAVLFFTVSLHWIFSRWKPKFVCLWFQWIVWTDYLQCSLFEMQYFT